MSFYPCFNGIRVGTKMTFEYEYFSHEVSILVLMELGLELARRILPRGEFFLRFYPCFNGIRVGTLK